MAVVSSPGAEAAAEAEPMEEEDEDDEEEEEEDLARDLGIALEQALSPGKTAGYIRLNTNRSIVNQLGGLCLYVHNFLTK